MREIKLAVSSGPRLSGVTGVCSIVPACLDLERLFSCADTNDLKAAVCLFDQVSLFDDFMASYQRAWPLGWRICDAR